MKSWMMVAGLLVGMLNATAGTVAKDVPSAPDPRASYLFYLHGLFPEMAGRDGYHPPFQRTYETTALAKAFADKGFEVITEVRPKGTDIEQYAARVALQVRQLVDAGVDPSGIAVVGHSKGGVMTLATAGMVAVPGVSFVVLAGCAQPNAARAGPHDPRKDYLAVIEKHAAGAKGRMLSLYDTADPDFNTCHEYASRASELTLDEQVVDTGAPRGRGHAAFYGPDPKWLEPVVAWIQRAKGN